MWISVRLSWTKKVHNSHMPSAGQPVSPEAVFRRCPEGKLLLKIEQFTENKAIDLGLTIFT